MSRGLSALLLSVCCIVSTAAPSQGQVHSANSSRGIVLEINIVETTGAKPDEIDKIEKVQDQLHRLISQGKMRVIASLQVRTRTGESFSARVGQRIPIQTATLPVFQPIERTAPDRREQVQSRGATSVGIPQIKYESPGLTVEGSSTQAGEGLLDLRLKLEMSGLDRSSGRLTPTFTQLTCNNVLRMKESETAVLMGVTQPESGHLSIEQIASGTTALARGSFIVLLTTRPVR